MPKPIKTLLYLLFLALVVEGAARLCWAVLDKSWGLVAPQRITRFDDRLGWALKEGERAVSKATGQAIEYRINSMGLRDDERPLAKASGAFRIVVLGDSHAFGFGVPEDKRFSELIEGYFPGVEVVNLGTYGYGVDQELLLLREKGFALQPDLVLAYVPHYADLRHLRDKLWSMGKPVFALQDGELRLTNSPVANNSWQRVALLDLDRFLSRWSKAYELLRDAVLHFVMRLEKVEPSPVAPELLARAHEMGQAIVTAMAGESAAHNASFAVVTRIGELAVDMDRKKIPYLYVHHPLANPAFELKNDPTRHPNEAANGVLAWEIAKFLKEKGLAPQAPPTQ